jgi:hypothetical protein
MTNDIHIMNKMLGGMREHRLRCGVIWQGALKQNGVKQTGLQQGLFVWRRW